MSQRKVRIKKLNPKTDIAIYTEDQIDLSEYEHSAADNQIATGVEQAEENEYHLQTILKEAGTSNHQEIPVPPPKPSELKYDELYPSRFEESHSYIKFSETVEECISCQYDMTSEDEEFLKQHNGKRAAADALSEDEFERIMDVFEETASAQTPFASVDNTVAPYDTMLPSLNQLGMSHILPHAKAIYEYWKSRRLECGNTSIHPSLKFETHQETDDMDPYVCFRRREARQTRKTRARDVQSAEKLKRLRRELEEGRQLIVLSRERELLKHELMKYERSVFEQRQKVKAMKNRLGIKGEDDDLIHQKPQKRKAGGDAPALQKPPGPINRQPPRADTRVAEPDLVLLEDKLAEKENELRLDLEHKVLYHRKWNQDYVDLTPGPLSPVGDQHMEDVRFRPARMQYLMTPPASSVSDSMDIDDEPMSPVEEKRPPVFQFMAGGAKELPPYHPRQPAFRRRIGRLGRLWIDRRGLGLSSGLLDDSSDRWTYDSDEDEEMPVYEVDPFSTTALRFRSTIPLPNFMWKRPKDPSGIEPGSSPNNQQVMGQPMGQPQPQANPGPKPQQTPQRNRAGS
ncbi:related to YMR164c and Gal11p [Cephalotrichum gorgonifer]|uniref:Enhancer of polycomb-like protein n=1 Tax=Cephalotrichum gorgonifer TaxID=2041049 RepID=A0AAE8MQH1_9PEZI|nr:related to YMR164c and Gal11p [Cephalotrichum gorgonifer]